MNSSNPLAFSDRPDWDTVFMEMTAILSTRSTCARLQTACILVRDKRIVSIGYNGVASGAKHCMDYWHEYWCENTEFTNRNTFEEFLKSPLFYDLHHIWSQNTELHGEQNAILHACKIGTSTNGTTLYTSYSPCINCAKVILTAGVQHVIYKHEYSRDLSGVEFLKDNNVIVTRF